MDPDGATTVLVERLMTDEWKKRLLCNTKFYLLIIRPPLAPGVQRVPSAEALLAKQLLGIIH